MTGQSSVRTGSCSVDGVRGDALSARSSSLPSLFHLVSHPSHSNSCVIMFSNTSSQPPDPPPSNTTSLPPTAPTPSAASALSSAPPPPPPPPSNLPPNTTPWSVFQLASSVHPSRSQPKAVEDLRLHLAELTRTTEGERLLAGVLPGQGGQPLNPLFDFEWDVYGLGGLYYLYASRPINSRPLKADRREGCSSSDRAFFLVGRHNSRLSTSLRCTPNTSTASTSGPETSSTNQTSASSKSSRLPEVRSVSLYSYALPGSS
jgi:hypothetical protein